MTKRKTRKPRITAVSIARDVIAQLRAGRYMACTGEYVLPDDTGKSNARYNKAVYEKPNTQFQKLLESKTFKCGVCAIGSMFCSVVRKVNEVTVGDLNNYYDSMNFRDKLLPYFSLQQLGLIESAFEGRRSYADDSGAGDNKASQASNWRYNCENSYSIPSNHVLIEICKNIIRNKGVFDVSQPMGEPKPEKEISK